MSISTQLATWYEENKRDLPWRKTQDPYKIWLSEIILQQTRIEQGLSYYYTFVDKYPTVSDLAKADLDEVLKDWEGLGYYSRARNLHFTANHVIESLGGVFPNTHSELIKLKGIGSYTAAAISSFSSREKKAVVDGNVYRFLGRLYNLEEPIDIAKGKKIYEEIADQLLPDSRSDIHNQAIMEFGSTHCTKHKPKCENCIFQQQCLSLKENTIELRPVKKKKLKVQNRFLNYYFISVDDQFLIQQRNNKGIWFKLFQLPLEESNNLEEFQSHKPSLEFLNREYIRTIKSEKTITHLLSHQKLHIRFWIIELSQLNEPDEFHLITPEESKSKAFPKPIYNFLQNQLKPKFRIK